MARMNVAGGDMAVVRGAVGTFLTIVGEPLALYGLHAEALVEWVIAGEMAVANKSARDMCTRGVGDPLKIAHD